MTHAQRPEAKSMAGDLDWDALLHGELTLEEEAVLKVLAEADDEFAASHKAYTPLRPAVEERIARSAERALALHRRKLRHITVSASTVLALAAAVLLMVRPAPSTPEMPAYHLRLSSGLAAERGQTQAEAVPRFDGDTELDLIVVPQTRVQGAVESRAYLVRGREILPLVLPLRAEPGGALRWKGPARALLVHGGGRFKLALAVGKNLPSEADVQDWVRAGDARVLFHELEYLEPDAQLLDEAARGALERATALRDQGEIAAAFKELLPLHKAADAGVRGRAASLEARLWLAQGETERAVSGLERAVKLAERAGLTKLAADDTITRADLLRRKLFRIADAEAALHGLEPHLGSYVQGQATLAYNLALCARDRGDVREALVLLERAYDGARRAGHLRTELAALEVRASLLHALGREREARAALAQAKSILPDNACRYGDYLINAGWLSILSAERGHGKPDFETLQKAYTVSTGACPEASDAQNSAVNLALAHLLTGDIERVRYWLGLAQGHGSDVEPTLASWWIDAEARLLLATGNARGALALYTELEARTGVAGEATDRWRAAYGVARAQRALGSWHEARNAYLRAEQALDEETLSIPFHAGRETFAGTRDASARELASLLLEHRDEAAAFRVMRGARTRGLRALELHDQFARLDASKRRSMDAALAEYLKSRALLEQNKATAFTAPLDEVMALDEQSKGLRRRARDALDRAVEVASEGQADPRQEPPEPGELLLAYFPLEQGWVGFAQSKAGLRTATLPAPTEANGRPAELLEPFARELLRASRVRFLAYGALRELALHALPFRGAPLIERVEVVYSADLGGAKRPKGSTALIVTDPRGNLAHARSEGHAVSERLQHAGKQVSMLEGHAATRLSVERAIASADLMHIAAHAEAQTTGERLGAILLADEQRWTVSDVLALKAVPREVVLSTCEGAREPDETRLLGLGLAQAFLARGAEAVIASTQRVPDALAREFALALYDAPDAELSVRYQHAVATLRARDPDALHWPSYRLWVR